MQFVFRNKRELVIETSLSGSTFSLIQGIQIGGL